MHFPLGERVFSQGQPYFPTFIATSLNATSTCGNRMAINPLTAYL